MSKTDKQGSFRQWLTHGGKLWYLAVALVVNVALQVFALTEKARGLLPETVGTYLIEHPSLAPAALHLAFIAVFALILVVRRAEILRKPTRHANEIVFALSSRRDLYYQWSALWLAWLALYATLTIQACLRQSHEFAFEFVTTIFNNLQTAALFALGWEMSELTQRQPSHDTDHWHNAPQYVFLLILLVIFSVCHLLLGPISEDVRTGFAGAAGVAGGVAIALFAGRLDSKVMAPPKALLVALYFYACIQALFPFLFGFADLELALLSVALILKVSMFMLVYWLFVSGRLVYYSSEIRRLIEQGDAHFAAFTHRYFSVDPDVDETPEVSEEPGKVLVLAAMSSLQPQDRATVKKAVRQIETELSRKGFNPSSFVEVSEPYEPPPQARINSFNEIACADIVVVLYTHAVASSLLVELGVALAKGKKIVLVSKHGLRLPYLLRSLSTSRRLEEEYDRLEDVGALVAGRCEYLRSQK